MIPFNKPPIVGTEIEHLAAVIECGKLCGDGAHTDLCTKWFDEYHSSKHTLLTTSGTHALEMAALLADIQQGDEVIMPSYTFSSTANAFALRGARIVFVDIRPDTMNIDENLIGDAINERTKAIVPVHYAGIACEMDNIMAIAKKYDLYVIEDAAQAMMSTYKGQTLGSIGDLGCFSFHETKNYTSGEGGALFVRDNELFERAEIIREKGTNRSRFWRGQVDKYTWTDIGSSYLPSELNAAFLYAQLKQAEIINADRLRSWDLYYELLAPLACKGLIELPYIPKECAHNAHMFYLKTESLNVRTSLMDFLKEAGIQSVFHYIPLHNSPAGKLFGHFSGENVYTTKESERLLRLPLFYRMNVNDVERVADAVSDFYRSRI